MQEIAPIKRILLVEDEEVDQLLITRALTRDFSPAVIDIAINLGEVRCRLQATVYDVVVTDYRLPGCTGADIIREVRAHDAGVAVLLLTGSGSEQLALDALSWDIDDYVPKTALSIEMLPTSVQYAWSHASMRRKRLAAEQALRESEQRQAFAVESMQAGHFDLNTASGEMYLSSRLREMIDLPEAAIGTLQSFLGKVHAGDVVRVRRYFTDLLAGRRETTECEFQIGDSDDHHTWMRVQSLPVRDEDGHVGRLVGLLLDVTTSKEMAHSLEHSRNELRRLAARQEELRETERRQISREIHDDLGQILTALRLEISLLARDAGEQSLSAQRAPVLYAMLDDAVAGVRRISSSLRPPLLDDLGLTAALEWITRDVCQRGGLSCRVALEEPPAALSAAEVTTVYRICQEALTNIIRHAGARAVSVRLHCGDGPVCLEVCDDGVGIERAAGGGLGLVGMRERASNIGATLEITRRGVRGTLVRLTLAERGDTRETMA